MRGVYNETRGNNLYNHAVGGARVDCGWREGESKRPWVNTGVGN